MKTLKNTFKLFVVIFLLLNTAITTHAQTRIMVEHENNTSIYTNIAAALENAPVGASVYLPGGRFALDTLKKELHLYGVGYFYPGDPNQRTIIVAFHIGAGADSSSISGMYFTQHAYLGWQLAGNIV